MMTVHEQTGIQFAAENRRRQGARFYAGSESVIENTKVNLRKRMVLQISKTKM
jgi:hypothetical protein